MSDQDKDLPAFPASLDPSLRTRLEAMREAVQKLMGTRTPSDKSGAAVRWRDLIDGGLAEQVGKVSGPTGSSVPGPVGPSGPPGPPGVAEPPDYTKPPTPTGFSATAAISNVLPTWGAPKYTVGHGHKQTNIYATKQDAADNTPYTINDAVRVDTAPGAQTIIAIASDPNTKWRLWIKFESVDGIESDPAGGINGVVVTTGQDPSALLEILQNQIGTSQLAQELALPISQIPSKISTYKQRAIPLSPVIGDLWLDEGSTNIMRWSENWAAWTSFFLGASLGAADSMAAPNGTSTAELLIEDTSNGRHFSDRYESFIAPGLKTLSARIKAGAGGRNAILGMYSTGNAHTAVIDLVTGAATVLEGPGTTVAGAKSLGGGWWLAWITANITNIGSPIQRVGLANGQAPIYLGSGTGSIASWGRQLEDGSGPGAYIKTESATVTTVGNNRIYRWDGVSWGDVTDQRLATLLGGPTTAGSVAAQVKTETDARVAAIAQEVADRNAAVATGVNTAKAYTETWSYSKAQADAAIASAGTTLRTDFNAADAVTLASANTYTSNYAYSKSSVDGALSSLSSTISAAYASADAATLNSAKTYADSSISSYAYSKAQSDSAVATSITTVKASIGAAGTNRMANSSCELDTDGDGMADGFTVYNNSGMAYTASRVPGRISGYAQRVDFTGPANTSQQGVIVNGANPAWAPGKTYVASFYARAGGGHVGLMMGHRWNVAPAASENILNPPLTSSWQLYAFRFTMGPTVNVGGHLHLTSADGQVSRNGFIDFDDFMIQEGDTLMPYSPGPDAGGSLPVLSAAIEQEASVRASQTGQLYAKVGVKLDVNGYVVGWALNNDGQSGNMIVRADTFAIGGTGQTSRYPFIVRTSSTSENGVSIPAGVYMDAAYIVNVSALWGRFGTLVADSIQAAEINAAKLTLGDGSIGGQLKSTNYTAGSQGWIVRPDGYAEFSNVVVRGTVYANSGAIGGSYLGSNYMMSTNWLNNSDGWRFNSDGTFQLNGTGWIKAVHIGAGEITSAKIADASIGTAKITDASITGAKISDLAVDTIKIKDNAVTVPVYMALASSFTNPSGQRTLLFSTAFDMGGQPIVYVWKRYANTTKSSATSGYIEVRFDVEINGVVVLSDAAFKPNAAGNTTSITIADVKLGKIQSSIGPNTISVYVYTYSSSGNGGNILAEDPTSSQANSMLLIGVKK